MDKKILVIEDNDDVRENVAEILELADYQVLTAPNGKNGIELAKTSEPDLIICDIMMPELDGYGVLHVLSKNENTSSIPFIFLTAKAEKTDFRKGMNLGADDYLSKPFDDTELLEAVEIRLKRTNSLQKTFGSSESDLHEFLDSARGLEDLNHLSDDRRTRKYHKKETIFFEADYPNCLYFINSGKVKTIKIDDYGKELVNDLYGDGQFFGYIPLLENEAYKETAIAIEETEISIVPKEDFISLVTKNRDVAHKFIKMLSNNITEKEERLLKLAYGTVRERTAEALLELKAKHHEPNSDDIRISREDLASIVGTATESLIRTLSEFRNDGIIEIEGRAIRLVNEQMLHKLAGK